MSTDRPDKGQLPDHALDDSLGGQKTSSVELGHVKQVLSVKMGNPKTHYTDITPLGKGSFGEVHSARDALLGREVAIKSLKMQFRDEEAVTDRFLKEARGTAQLEHPNIMPVHEMGVMDELGIYFTMKKIEGVTLKEILDQLNAGNEGFRERYPLSVLLEIFLSVCNGVSFAHSKGVIHRDLKPANIMIGEFGEVLILDWGLVKKVDQPGEDEDKRVTLRMEEFDTGENTLDGAVSGTPNYMAPEQAEGWVAKIDQQSDVYSLGAILYHILTYLPPFERAQIHRLLDNVKSGNFRSPRKRCPDLNVPRELEAVCLKAMARQQVSRYSSVEQLALDIRNFIGHREVSAYRAPPLIRFWKSCKRNPVKSSVAAAVLVALGLAFALQRSVLFGIYRDDVADADELRMAADELVLEARQTFDGLQALRHATEMKEKSVEERRLEQQLAEEYRNIDRMFNLAASHYEGVPLQYRYREKILNGFSDIMKQRIDLALYMGEYDLARQWYDTVMAYIEIYGRAPSAASREYLDGVAHQIEGRGVLEIAANSRIREYVLFPLYPDGPRLIQGDPIHRGGELPVSISDLEKGSYLLLVTHPDGSYLPFPVLVEHGETVKMELEIPADVPAGMAFIPGGPFYCGGEESRFYRLRKRSIPSYFIRTHEVTVGEYLEFWKALTDPAQKAACMSRIRYNPDERFYTAAWDENGVLLDERLDESYPVVGISIAGARAYCEWLSVGSGRTIRLPTAEEWEKAARGVDARIYPWGNGFDPEANLALTKRNESGKENYPYWAPPGSFGRDISPYNVYDMGGNVREMTSTLLPDSTTLHQLKGGSSSTPSNFLPCSYSSDTPVVPSDVGFRYVMEYRQDEHL